MREETINKGGSEMGLVNSVSLKNGVFNFIHEHERHDEKDM